VLFNKLRFCTEPPLPILANKPADVAVEVKEKLEIVFPKPLNVPVNAVEVPIGV